MKISVVKFLTKQGMSAQTTMGEMSLVQGDYCPEKTMIFKWYNRFRQGRESHEDDSRRGRSIEVNVKKKE